VNTATAPLEDQLRATLRRHAGHTAPRADATDVRRRVQRRRRRRQVVPAVGAVAVIAAGIVVTSVKHDNSRTSTAAEVPGGPSFTPRADGPAYVELPGWQLERYAEIRYPADADTPAVTEPEYQWTRGGQRMQLHVYPGGNAMYEVRVGSDARSDAKVYGKDASLLDYGTGRYRVDVLIGEATFEFDGEQFASADEFIAAIEEARPTASAPPADVTAEPLDLDIAFDVAVNEPAAGGDPPNAVVEAETGTTSRPAPGGK
jgi:hypothetical protein